MKRWIRAPARPSAPRAKSAVFCPRLRHLRRRGTSLCLVTYEAFSNCCTSVLPVSAVRDDLPPETAWVTSSKYPAPTSL
jgi:hypothetical protein